MQFLRGDTCYILESNMKVKAAKVINRQGDFYTIQLVGTCGAIRLKESRLFKTEQEAKESKKEKRQKVETPTENQYGYVDVFAGRRTNKTPYEW